MTTSAIDTPVSAPGVPGPVVARLAEMPGVNLIPREVAERAELRTVKAVCAGALALSLLAVGGLWYHAHGGVTSAQSGLTQAQGQQKSVQSQVDQIAYVAQTYATVEAAKVQVAEALGGEIQWSSYLDDLKQTIPSDVWLSGMTVAVGGTTNGSLASTGIATITFQGHALSRDAAATWLESLVKEHGYKNPYLTTTTESKIGTTTVVDFVSTVAVTTDALSGRYTATSTPSGS